MKKIKNFWLCFMCVFMTQTLLAQPQQGAVIPTGKKFYIQSAMNYKRDNGGYWDLPGKPTTIEKGANIQVWTLDEGHDRIFTLIETKEKGFYEIAIGNTPNIRVDIHNGATANGTNVRAWENNGGNAQRFLFEHLGGGRLKIHDRNGRLLCLADRSSENGKNVHTWGNHDGVWMEWHLIDVETKQAFIPTQNQKVEAAVVGDEIPTGKVFYIQSALNQGRDDRGFWDFPGKGAAAIKKDAEMQVWQLDTENDRLFRFEKANNGQYYKIYVGRTGNSVIDLKGGKAEDGAQAVIWDAHNGQSQDFYLKHLGDGRFKIHHRGGKILTLKGKKNDNGTKVNLWGNHDGMFNEWYLIDPDKNRPYVPGAGGGAGGKGKGN